MTLDAKLHRLKENLSHLKQVAVAFSGGVDSTLLLKVACDTLGVHNVIALTACTQLVPEHEQQEALDFASEIGVRHELIHEDILKLPEVADNPRERCYHCKHHIFSLFRSHLQKIGISSLVDGTNHDDLSEDRPGLKALEELGVGSPLAECGIGKAEVRILSRQLGLPTAERPSFACLASTGCSTGSSPSLSPSRSAC